MLEGSQPGSQEATLEYAIAISRHLSYLFWGVLGLLVISYSAWNTFHPQRQLKISSRTIKCQKWLSRSLVGSRHAEPVKLYGLPVGTTPTGGQTTVLIAYTLFNVLACTLGYRTAPTNAESEALQLCKYIALRTGIMGLANLPLVVGLAGRNNVLALITGVSKHSLNTLHRWSARMVLILSISHTACYLVSYGLQVEQESYLAILHTAYSKVYFKAGIAALVGLLFLTTHSLRFLRDPYYNLFRILHIIGVLAFLLGTLFHAIYAETGGKVAFWLYISLGLFFLDHLARLVQIVYVNCPTLLSSSIRGTSVCLTPINAEITKVVVTLPRRTLVREGETIYILIPRLSIYQWHPFTVINSAEEDYRRLRQSSCDTVVSVTSTLFNNDCGSEEEKLDSEKAIVTIDSGRSSAESDRPATAAPVHQLQLRIKARGPFSKAVNHLATSRPDLLRVRAFVQPVLQRSFLDVERYDTLVLVAGGIGITAILPVLRRALGSRSERPRDVSFVWCVKSFDEFANLADELESLVSTHRADLGSKTRLCTSIYVTSGVRPWPLTSSCSLPIRYRRPELDTILAESTTTPGRTGIAACGPPRLVDDIRSWITGAKCAIPIDYHDHSF